MGLNFARPVGVQTGPFEVICIVPGSAAHLSGVVRVGNLFCAVNACDERALTSEGVKGPFPDNGAPSTAFTMNLCFSNKTQLAACASMQGMHRFKVIMRRKTNKKPAQYSPSFIIGVP